MEKDKESKFPKISKMIQKLSLELAESIKIKETPLGLINVTYQKKQPEYTLHKLQVLRFI